jgi:class 3 adenylate cyclase
MARETRHMAVLFADVTNGTALYHKLGDAGAPEVIALALEAMAGLLPSHGGRLVKTLGDAVMCGFAEPEDAVHAGEISARPRRGERAGDVLHFQRDRRSMYRV